MSIQEIRISSLGELVDLVTPTEPDERSGRRRDTGIYRGGAKPFAPLLTSLDRLGGVEPPHTKTALEAHIFRTFARYSRSSVQAPPPSDWEVLVLAQHHGLPTRLLDWTFSPLVAAHFATLHPERDTDRVIWRLEWKPVHERFDLPGLALSIEDLEDLLGGNDPFTPWRLFEADPRDGEFACMIEPPSLNGRIVAQSAVFTVTSDRSSTFDAFLARHGLEESLTRIVVGRDAVSHLRDQLDMVSVDERRLFPDLDGLAARVRRYYS